MKSCFLMEWNTKTPLQWEWENLVMFNGKINEIPMQTQPTDWETEGDGGIDNGSLYSCLGGRSGSDLGNGSSSKSSISASIDSSAKGRINISKFNFETIEGFPEDPTKKKELNRLEDTGSSPTLGVSVGSGEPLIGLKLGKRTYFEDVCAGSTVKPPSFSVIPAAKRSRASYQSMETPCCQVEGCDLDLTSAKDYHRRHRVCESHSKCPKVTVSGLERRFCQQCSRFHELSEFDEKKRSCRRRLSDHNARRRKSPPEATQFSSTRFSSSFYDGRQQMSFTLNRFPLVHTTKLATNPTWERRAAKPGGSDGQHFSNSGLLSSVPSLRHESDRLLSFKGTTVEVLNQGDLEASMLAPNLDPTPDLRGALSLLSSNSWSSGDPEHSSIDQLMHATQSNVGVSVPQGWPLASLEYWQAQQQQAADSRVHPLPSPNQFQEFQLFKTPPYKDGFYSNQMN